MKLSDDEIEEYKHENYQMMAAISGKPISELIGESQNRPSYKENYCLIKQMYLKNCAEPISNQIADGHPTLKGRVCFGPSADCWES